MNASYGYKETSERKEAITDFVVYRNGVKMDFKENWDILVNSREMIKNSRGQIATQIESRWDALTSLIQVTKQYSSHKANTIESAVSGLSSLGNNMSSQDFKSTEDMFQGSLSRLIAVAEAYPELKTSEVYKQTMNSIEKI